MATFQPGGCDIIKRSEVRLTSALASMCYGPLCRTRALPLSDARLYARHLLDSDKPAFEHEMPAYTRTKAILLREPLRALLEKGKGGNYFIRIEGAKKNGTVELIQLHSKFITKECLDMESQLILMSEGWKTSAAGKGGAFITRLAEGCDAESYPVPAGKFAGQDEKYVVIDVDAKEYPHLFGEKAEGVVRLGLPKKTSGGLATVGCGPCLEGVIIPKFEWHCSVLVHADGT